MNHTEAHTEACGGNNNKNQHVPLKCFQVELLVPAVDVKKQKGL